jgi:hypothetical protein
MPPFVSWSLDFTKGRKMRLAKKIHLRAILAAAAATLAVPAFAHAHDFSDQQEMQKSTFQRGEALPAGSKRLLREMAKSDGDPQGLAAVPHGATLQTEYVHARDRSQGAANVRPEQHASHKED